MYRGWWKNRVNLKYVRKIVLHINIFLHAHEVKKAQI